MKEFTAKTAVITGAGSGIGHALAFAAAGRGMNVVLADINEKDLSTVSEALEAEGAATLVVPTDVSKYEAIEHLADKAEKTFGNVHLLFNNAGVSSAPKPIWESSLSDWAWVVGVNQMSVVYGVKAFVPRLLAHGEPAHVVNTASIAGLISNSRMNAYGVTKHAVVALSETLFLDLKEAGSKIGVSVLCPAWVKTQIHTSERNRPREERSDPRTLDSKSAGVASAVMGFVESGLELARLYAPDLTLILIGRKLLPELDEVLFTEETYCRCDLAREDAAETVVAWLAARGITHLDLLIHNAAVGWYGDVARQSEKSVDELLNVNLYAPILLTRTLLPHLKRAKGKVVFINSVAADLSAPDYTVYGATKAALAGFARNLWLEQNEVRVQTFFPGAIDTPMHQKSGVPAGKFKRERFSSAEEVARQVYRAAASPRSTATSGLGNKALRALGHYFPSSLDAVILKFRG